MRVLAKNLLFLLLLGAVIGYLARRFPDLSKGTDFVHFYCAARMVSEGAGHRLYDFQLQEQFQARYAGRVGTYFVHPPFEALIYLPFTLLPLSSAYALWSGLNAALLVLSARLLQRLALRNLDWRAVSLACLSFVPALVTLLQGQDSILQLLLFTAAFAGLRRQKEFLAGCLLAGGLFKFQLALPLFLMVLPGRTRRFVAGFAAVGGLLVLASVAVSGWGSLVDYPRALLQFSQLPLAAVHPREEMANLRGLAAVFFPNPQVAEMFTLAGTLAIFWLAIRGGKGAGSRTHSEGHENLAWASAVIGSLLVAYHQSPCDLTLLLLPLAFSFHLFRAGGWASPGRRAIWIGLALLLFLPPLHLVLLNYHFYSLMAIPLLSFFWLVYGEIMRPAAPSPSQ